MEVLEVTAQERFVAELADYLCARHIAVLPRFPLAERHTIVRIMIARSRGWGATWKASISLYADFMQRIAPNFDRYPAIGVALRTGGEDADERILSLADRVPHRSWAEAEAERVELYLYTPPEFDGLALAQRTAQALPIVLWDHVPADAALAISEQGTRLADRLGIAQLDDGPLVSAAALALYGQRLNDLAAHPWILDIHDPGRRPSERLEMLRLRIALDFGRRV
jgi:hypothetical protein